MNSTQTKDRQQLIKSALEASRHSVATYSHFQVGAALRAGSGKIYTGVNVESASYGLTCCAERVALFKALSEGERQFEEIAIVAPAPNGAMPCGACRQLLAEFAPQANVHVADARKTGLIRTFTVEKLLPEAFLEVPASPPQSRND